MKTYKKEDILNGKVEIKGRGTGEIAAIRADIKANYLKAKGDVCLFWDLAKIYAKQYKKDVRNMSVRLTGGLTKNQGFNVFKHPDNESGRKFVERIS